ncbi:hypothetical protein AGLY_016026 [Aphis glycines]|uniref:Uncharacterized protein n=1 Tax=Aphis glycines TaxID=307491 RepID=A0A6G0SZT9_APHGL|nr:hypothetical protein AGLY_016026 [Aphis glycines]
MINEVGTFRDSCLFCSLELHKIRTHGPKKNLNSKLFIIYLYLFVSFISLVNENSNNVTTNITSAIVIKIVCGTCHRIWIYLPFSKRSLILTGRRSTFCNTDSLSKYITFADDVLGLATQIDHLQKQRRMVLYHRLQSMLTIIRLFDKRCNSHYDISHRMYNRQDEDSPGNVNFIYFTYLYFPQYESAMMAPNNVSYLISNNFILDIITIISELIYKASTSRLSL